MMLRFFTPFLLAAILLACSTDGPRKVLDNAAKAMENNNPGEFLTNIDLKAYTANYLTMRTTGGPVLDMLNDLGNAIGLGSIDNLINNFVDVEADLREDFTMGVSTGELMAHCRSAETPNCPWVPQSLRNAAVTEISQDAAIAKVTTPAQLTSWLALHKSNGKWLIVAVAPLESQARKFSMQQAAPIPQKAPSQPGSPAPKTGSPKKQTVPEAVHI